MSTLMRQPPGALARVDDVVRTYALAEKANATRRAYHADFSLFAAWCLDRGGAALGAAPSWWRRSWPHKLKPGSSRQP